MILLLCGFPKSYTSSTYKYILSSSNFIGLNTNNKETGHFKYSTEVPENDKVLVDGTQHYLFDKNFHQNISQVSNYKMLMLSRDRKKRYEAMFKMMHEKHRNMMSFNEAAKKYLNLDNSKQNHVNDLKDYLSIQKKSAVSSLETDFIRESYLNQLTSPITKLKLSLIDEYNIDELFELELKQYRENNFDNTLCILPMCFNFWVLDDMFKNIKNLKSIYYHHFEDSNDIIRYLKVAFADMDLEFSPTEDFPYVKPSKNERIEAKTTRQLTTPKATFLFDRDQKRISELLEDKIKLDRTDFNY